MRFKPVSARAISIWSSLAALEGLLTAFFLAREPSEAENVVALGLSSQRLLILAVVLFLTLFFCAIALLHTYRFISWAEEINKRPGSARYGMAGALVLEIIALNLLLFFPDYHFPSISAYLPRLKPILVWLALFGAQTFLFLAYFGGLSLEYLRTQRGKFPVLVVIVIIGLIWGLVTFTGLGITPDQFYWNVAGVPILTGQIWVAIGITLSSWFMYKRSLARKGPARKTSFVIFIGIWVVAAIIWVETRLAPTFNAPGPYLPSNDIYPFVDAALFDLGAQSALYGKGLFFGSFIDRGLLSGFLALLHRIFGQNYLVVANAQSALFAVFPALLYLLGEKLHSKAVGLMAAMLAIFKVSNAIRVGKLISTSHPKLMLTEFPTGIVLVLFSLLLVLWLIKSNSKAYYLAGVGASIGVGILLRNNVFFMIPVVSILGIVVWKLDWKRALRDTLLVLIAFFITISPWMWRNQRVAGKPLFFLTQFNRVIEERYQPQSQLDPDRLASGTSPRSLGNHVSIARIKTTDGIELEKFKFIPQHFVHNLITSALILPPSPVLDDLRHTLDNYPYWDRIEGSSLDDISTSLGIFLAANLMILSIGIGTAWRSVKHTALVPLAVFLFYNLANAFARTSGGRYIVPVDWVVYFYFAIGLVEIIRFCISALGFHANGFVESENGRQDQGNAKLNWGRAGLVTLPFFLIVAMLPLIELASPGEKPAASKESLLEQLSENSFFEISGISRQQLEGFLGNQNALLISGRGFYPRYYSYEEGEPILPNEITPYTVRAFPRLVFTLLLPNGDRPVVLPIDEPRLHFPDAAEVIVAGCQVGQSKVLTSYLNYIDAAFVVILEDPATIHLRVPQAPLVCPLREPVCDNNHNCK